MDAQQFGCLDRISAFPYENHLQKIKRLVRKPDCPFAQIIPRLSEQTSYGSPGASTVGASDVASSSKLQALHPADKKGQTNCKTS